MSFEPGNNEVFFSYEKAPGWPLSDSDIVLKPVLKLDGEYHAYVPQLLLRGMSSILEEWVREADKAYFRNKWKPRSADYLEAEARKYLMQALPGAQYYSSAHFEFDPGDGDGFRRFETDGLLVYDDILLVVEAKAGALSKSTRRGSSRQLRRDAKELVGYAAAQGFRVLDYMSANQEAEFIQEDGSPLVTLNRSEIREAFVVNVTLEYLGHIATKMPTLRELNVVGGGDWVWSVFLNDLRIVAELVETPSEFILYLRRRLGSNEFVFEATDEIDFLGFFLSEGLFFEASDLGDLDKFVPHGYSAPIDRWYDFVAERVGSADKPRLQIDDRMKALVKELDSSVHGARTEAGTLLLSLEAQLSEKLVNEVLPNLQSLAKQDGNTHDFTLVPGDEVHGLTIAVVPDSGSAPDEDYALRQMLAKGRSRWIQINYNLDLKLHSAHPPRSYSAPAEFPKRIVDSVERISLKRVREVVGDSPRSYPRNEKCPCRSGKKYKKCCLSRLQP